MRFVLTVPVDGGNQYYNIADTKLDIEVVSISNTIPLAEKYALYILNGLNEDNQA